MSLRWLPNAITISRIALTVPLLLAIVERRFELAITLAVVAGLTDALDGLLAKRFGWSSRLGGFLDPLADKLMLAGSFVALAHVGLAPVWITWLVLGRDLVIVAGALAYHFLIGPLWPAPTRLSKLTTCLQIALVVTLLIDATARFELPVLLGRVLLIATALATVASGLHYVLLWTRRARENTR